MKNLLTLHEAIILALIGKEGRNSTFDEIADFIERRNLFPIRKGNIPLAKQIMLRSTQGKKRYEPLFEQISDGRIRLRNF